MELVTVVDPPCRCICHNPDLHLRDYPHWIEPYMNHCPCGLTRLTMQPIGGSSE